MYLLEIDLSSKYESLLILKTDIFYDGFIGDERALSLQAVWIRESLLERASSIRERAGAFFQFLNAARSAGAHVLNFCP